MIGAEATSEGAGCLFDGQQNKIKIRYKITKFKFQIMVISVAKTYYINCGKMRIMQKIQYNIINKHYYDSKLHAKTAKIDIK